MMNTPSLLFGRGVFFKIYKRALANLYRILIKMLDKLLKPCYNY